VTRIDPDISVVVPVYRNADTVSALRDRLRQVLDAERMTSEIVFVNDACPADSLVALRELAARDATVRVLSLDRNVGQHRAVLTGLAEARGRHVVVMDADLQDPPEAVPQMRRTLMRGYDAVFAGRRGRYESTGRLVTSRVFKTLLRLASGVPRDAGMYIVMTRRMVERLLAQPVKRPYVVAMIGRSGLPTTSVPVRRSPRPAGHSSYTSRMRLRNGCLALWVAVSRKWPKWRAARED
jgi:glycosyltransferase involved in cell wall biosynthesis